ncbi:MAG: hypothetical protein ACKJSK_05950 [Roseibacillus sp.]
MGGLTPVLGGVAVNSSLEITHRVRVQPIVTRKADGTTTTFLGGASIESYIDRVWAQSGVVIEGAPEVEDTNDFAYDGSSNDYSSAPRPQPDLRVFERAGIQQSQRVRCSVSSIQTFDFRPPSLLGTLIKTSLPAR